MPPPGMFTSSTQTWGRRWRTSATAPAASPACPTTLNPATAQDLGHRLAHRCVVVGEDHRGARRRGVGDGHRRGISTATIVPPSGAETIEHRPPRRSARSRIDMRPNPRPVVEGSRPATVVDDAELEQPGIGVEVDGDLVRIGVPDRIRDGLLGDPPELVGGAGIDADGLEIQHDRAGRPVLEVPAEPVEDAIEGDRGPVGVLVDPEAGLRERPLGAGPDPGDALGVGRIRLREGALGGQIGQLLGQSVVQLGGEGPPFPAPRLGRQLTPLLRHLEHRAGDDDPTSDHSEQVTGRQPVGVHRREEEVVEAGGGHQDDPAGQPVEDPVVQPSALADEPDRGGQQQRRADEAERRGCPIAGPGRCRDASGRRRRREGVRRVRTCTG